MLRGRPKKLHPSPFITISDQMVTWSFIKFVYKRLGCSWDDTIDAFWKARHCKGSNAIYRYIMSGFRPTARGVVWIKLPSKEREQGKMESIREWWLTHYQPKRQNNIICANQEIKSMLDNLAEKFSI